MLEGLISLASGAYYGGGFGDFLFQLEQYGFFSYLLPFLLIFALVFGILRQAKIFKDEKAITGIIAMVVGFLALQFDFVPMFFSEIFPRLGVALAVLLLVLILMGMFVDPSQAALGWTLLGIGAVITIIVLVNTAGAVGWSSGYWWSNNWPVVAGAVFILVLIGVIVGGSSEEKKPYRPLMWFDPSSGGSK